MPHESLNDPDVCAIFQQMRRKAVTQHPGTDAIHSNLLPDASDDLFDRPLCNPVPFPIQVDPLHEAQEFRVGNSVGHLGGVPEILGAVYPAWIFPPSGLPDASRAHQKTSLNWDIIQKEWPSRTVPKIELQRICRWLAEVHSSLTVFRTDQCSPVTKVNILHPELWNFSDSTARCIEELDQRAVAWGGGSFNQSVNLRLS
jgi:hypothetical protein